MARLGIVRLDPRDKGTRMQLLGRIALGLTIGMALASLAQAQQDNLAAWTHARSNTVCS